jgi:hypothetical protein
MTLTIGDDETYSGFILSIVAEKLADVKFVNDFSLVIDTIEGAQLLLERLETAAISVGLAMNESKTNFMTFNSSEE